VNGVLDRSELQKQTYPEIAYYKYMDLIVNTGEKREDYKLVEIKI